MADYDLACQWPEPDRVRRSLVPFGQRLDAGKAHEEVVRRAMLARGWAVRRTGQENLPEALQGHGPALRNLPDLVGMQGRLIKAVNAKTHIQAKGSRTYCIASACVRADESFIGWCHVPLYYVLGNMRCLTPSEVADYRMPTASGEYYEVDALEGHPFDDVFGPPLPGAVMALPAAA